MWHFHCHMAHHLYYGMGMVIDAAPEFQQLFPPPPGFPQVRVGVRLADGVWLTDGVRGCVSVGVYL